MQPAAPPPPQMPAQQVQYQQMQHYPQGWAHPAMAAAPMMVPMNYQMPGAQIPAYLAVPEPPGPWWQRLFFSVLRASGKATGHTVANFFDHNSINPWERPPGM